MCFNSNSGNNCSCLWWIIIIVLVLCCCCGNGCSNGENCGSNSCC